MIQEVFFEVDINGHPVGFDSLFFKVPTGDGSWRGKDDTVMFAAASVYKAVAHV
jgi:hypothetical protein